MWVTLRVVEVRVDGGVGLIGPPVPNGSPGHGVVVVGAEVAGTVVLVTLTGGAAAGSYVAVTSGGMPAVDGSVAFF